MKRKGRNKQRKESWGREREQRPKEKDERTDRIRKEIIEGRNNKK